jgi:hypothetical protein
MDRIMNEHLIMLKINEDRRVTQRIVVHPDKKEHFKNLGYAENIKEGYDPQITHEIDHRHVHLKKEHINYKLKFKERLVWFLRQLLFRTFCRDKNKFLK